MKKIKGLFKFIFIMIFTIAFCGFLGLVLVNTTMTNVVFNNDYYQELIYETELAEEVRMRVLKNQTKQFVENYNGEIDIEVAEKIVLDALLETFPNHWFKNSLNLFAEDIVEFGLYNHDKFFSSVEIKDEKINYRKNLAKEIEKTNESLTTEQIVFLTDQIDEFSDFPNQIVFEEVLDNHFDKNVLGHIMNVPKYRDSLSLIIYFGFGIFAFLFYFLLGFIRSLRWLGGLMVLIGGVSVYGYFNHLETALSYLLGRFQIASVFASYFVEKGAIYILRGPVSLIIIGLIFIVVGILIEPKKSKKNSLKKTKEIESLKEEVIELDFEEIENDLERVENKLENDPEKIEIKLENFCYDVSEEKPASKVEERIEYDIYQEIDDYIEPVDVSEESKSL